MRTGTKRTADSKEGLNGSQKLVTGTPINDDGAPVEQVIEEKAKKRPKK